MNEAKKVRICESLPRDGLQEITKFIPTEQKIEVMKRIIDLGFRKIDALSFSHPKWVPQFADAEAIAAGILPYAEAHGAELTASVLNTKAVERAKAAHVHRLYWCGSISEGHSRRNTNKSIEDTLVETRDVLAKYTDENTVFNMSIMCAFGDPFGQPLDVDMILRYCELALHFGVDTISLSDTAGLGDPETVRRVVRRVREYVPLGRICLHLHDSQGMGLASTIAGFEEGVIEHCGSLGGQGGCPFAPGSRGNVATEDLLNMFQKMGVDTGVDAKAALKLSRELGEYLDIPMSSAMLTYTQTCFGKEN